MNNENLQEKRLSEFVWYHINGDGDCNGQVLRAFSKLHCLSEQEKFDLSYFYSVTYCCASAVFLLRNRGRIANDCERFSEWCIKNLIFQSDRRYMRCNGMFYKAINFWKKNLCTYSGKFMSLVATDGIVDDGKCVSIASSWPTFGRFSAFLFCETYCDIFGLRGSHDEFEKVSGDSMMFIAGLLFVFCRDVSAKIILSNRVFVADRATFDELMNRLKSEIKAAGGDDNFTKIETSLCAYAKFFKGTRYNGYYADRMLQELVKLETNPLFRESCSMIFDARRRAIPRKYLGEVNGWRGIRKKLNNFYIERGEINGRW